MTTENRNIRLWPLWVILAFDVIATVAIFLIPDMSQQNRTIGLLTMQFFTVVFAMGWFLFLSRLPWKTRLLGLAAAVIFLLLAGFSLEIRDFSGDMLPELAFKWSPKPDEQLDSNVKTADSIELSQSDAVDYPRFLGPDGNAMVKGTFLARSWDTQPPKEVWRQKVGLGWSAFSVSGGLAVTQEQRGEQEMVTCYRLQDGTPVWAYGDNIRFSSSLGGDGPRATPTIDNGQVFTLGGTGVLTCLELATGKKVWSRDLKAEHKGRTPEWGYSTSPLVTDNLIVVAIGGGDGRSMVAHDRHSGDFVWGGGSDRPGYSSPQLRTLAGTPQILILNGDTVGGHDPATGAVLWEDQWGKGTPNVANPLVIDENRLLVSSGYGVGSILYELSSSNGKVEAKRAYETTRLKAKFANYVLHQNYVYGLDDGILTCVDTSDGSRKWKKGRYGHGQLILVEDLLLVQSEAGVLHLIEANPDAHNLLGSIPVLGDKSWNNAALAGNLLLMRNHMEAVCLELPLAQ